MDKHRFFYQPSLILAVIDWCWTLIVLLTGIIFWLEVTHFQWITLLFLIAFFIISGLELLDRQLVIQNHYLEMFNWLHCHWRRFNLRQIRLGFRNHQLIIIDGHNEYRYLMFRRDYQRLNQLLIHHQRSH